MLLRVCVVMPVPYLSWMSGSTTATTTEVLRIAKQCGRILRQIWKISDGQPIAGFLALCYNRKGGDNEGVAMDETAILRQ